MASRVQPDAARRPAPRLYLVTPPVSDRTEWTTSLGAVLQKADIAAVLLSFDAADDRTLVNRAKAVAPAVQNAGAALLLDGHPDLVARAGADGAHLRGVDALRAALPSLKPDRIAGCGGLATRHDAMVAAEAGADYVMFGEPDTQGRRAAFSAIAERVAWWAEVFEVPCVGYAASPDEAIALAGAGADFVALGPFVFEDIRGPALAVEDTMRRLVSPERAA
jgi:thiamine-phosphate pyrophosphorylase